MFLLTGLPATTGNRRSRKQNSALNDGLRPVSVSSRAGGKQLQPQPQTPPRGPGLGVGQVAGIASSAQHGTDRRRNQQLGRCAVRLDGCVQPGLNSVQK
jgi:hypothetical protein